jgi:hypothetical protein
MKVLLSPADQTRARQWLADLHEDLDLYRYPTRVELMRTVDEAARRADSFARLEYALEHLPLPGIKTGEVGLRGTRLDTGRYRH